MTNQFHKLLLSELHMAFYQPGDLSRLNDRLLCEAVTLNENLQSLGFVLKPEALVQLAVSPSLHTFFDDVKALVPEVKAQPMYPGFPQQVMELSEAEFRMHQMIHYFSTYGMESLFGVQVSRGWLPAYRGPARTREDTTLLDTRVLDLVAEEEAPLKVLSILLARRERLTNPELDLVVEASSACTAQQMQGLTVRFKENLDLLFPKLLEEAHRDTALRTLGCICSHSGDVLRCTAGYLSRRRYHLRTSEKKLLVKLLESYSLWNFRQNLMPSNSLRERNLMILQHLDYNKYSRSAEHKEAVRALRNDELLSWQGIGEELLKSRSPKALEHLAQRPGYMLRMLNRLLSLGYSKDDILEVLAPKSGSISGQLILQAIRSLSGRGENLGEKLDSELWACRMRHNQMDWECQGWMLDIPFDEQIRTLTWQYQEQIRRLESSDCRSLERKSCKQEARRKTLTARQEKRIRLGQAQDNLNQQLEPLISGIAQKKATLEKLKDVSVFHRWPYLRAVARYGMEQTSDTRIPTDTVLAEYLPFRFRKQQEPLQQQINHLETELADETDRLNTIRTMRLMKVRQEIQEVYDEVIRQIQVWEQAELARLEEKYRNIPDPIEAAREDLTKQYEADLASIERQRRQKHAEANRQLHDRETRMKRDLAAIEEKYQRIERSLPFNATAVEILRELLREHFRQAVTPLKGRKVFCDMGQFDLKHSSLETGSRSKDGGYIRSGIAWKIPDNAKYVRFFVYWNDPERVDIDLHAGGTTLDGKHLHVGWNADFRNGGVVHSGDITHSNAAEYIDIDLSAPIREISANVSLFSGKHGFRDIQTCYVGMMAVDQPGQNVKLYSPKNCFFTHTLTQNIRSLFYGFVDVQNRCVRFVGQPNDYSWDSLPRMDDTFSLRDYLDCVLDGQQVQVVDHAEDADVILSMGKSLSEKGISLVDHNFFLEC